MITFIMLTKLAPDSLKSPRALEDLERTVMAHVRGECPQVEWLANYAVLGPVDYVDIFRAPDLDTAMTVTAAMRMVAPRAADPGTLGALQARTTRRVTPHCRVPTDASRSLARP